MISKASFQDLGDAPVQPRLLELLVPRGVFGADQLSRAAAHADTFALTEARRELLQVVASGSARRWRGDWFRCRS